MEENKTTINQYFNAMYISLFGFLILSKLYDEKIIVFICSLCGIIACFGCLYMIYFDNKTRKKQTNDGVK